MRPSILGIQRNGSRVLAAAHRQSVCGGAGRGVGARDECDNCADHDGSFAGPVCADQGVAVLIVRLHGYGGHGEVGAVDADGCGLGEAGAGVGGLDGGVDGDGGDEKEEDEVDLGGC